ncbi:hypothetical protein CCY99_02805 [Helicobacter sp. 16-1353]|uniref:hypothetical protein n=1 Tax=Helicobacter sp. 16-1353 TaxID=2004996 RepID=UPI000DCD9491|nr:hypothetical protein [Helicobacter sp. 16-1353]RAX54708.1 hypothetical protein CCY99_02805 [Helicobacter sp. 16-1353]
MEDIFKVINKKVKNKVNILINTILPSKIPEFSINEVEEPIFFIYLNKNEIAFISHLDNKEADEIIKVGITNNEFVFYPLKENSMFFGKDFEFKTFEFIEVILSNKLHLIAKKIYKDICFLSDKILEYKTVYISKLKNIDFFIDVVDNSNITNVNETLNSLFNNAIKDKLYNIAKTNILDTPLNIFGLIFPDGIHEISYFMEQKSALEASMLKNYYNKSNIANPKLIESLQVEINGKEFEFEYCINSFFLQYSVTKKIFAKAKVCINNINALNIQPDTILYSNNDLKVVVKRNNIAVYNQTDSSISLYGLCSIFLLDNNKPFETKIENINLKIPINEEISMVSKKDTYFGTIKNLNTDIIKNGKIKHSIKLTYSLSNNKHIETKNLVGSSQYMLCDIFDNINN